MDGDLRVRLELSLLHHKLLNVAEDPDAHSAGVIAYAARLLELLRPEGRP